VHMACVSEVLTSRVSILPIRFPNQGNLYAYSVVNTNVEVAIPVERYRIRFDRSSDRIATDRKMAATIP
ncbi:MAG TPA: hypothetical protein VMU77_03430, partial [Acidimicrobiales bacterium]|nr:hypothetical protein [Acidimicrobiales bacterium]